MYQIVSRGRVGCNWDEIGYGETKDRNGVTCLILCAYVHN